MYIFCFENIKDSRIRNYNTRYILRAMVESEEVMEVEY